MLSRGQEKYEMAVWPSNKRRMPLPSDPSRERQSHAKMAAQGSSILWSVITNRRNSVLAGDLANNGARLVNMRRLSTGGYSSVPWDWTSDSGDRNGGEIRFVPLRGGQAGMFAIKDYPNVAMLTWAADSKSLFAVAPGQSSVETLLHIDQHGSVQPVFGATDRNPGQLHLGHPFTRRTSPRHQCPNRGCERVDDRRVGRAIRARELDFVVIAVIFNDVANCPASHAFNNEAVCGKSNARV